MQNSLLLDPPSSLECAFSAIKTCARPFLTSTHAGAGFDDSFEPPFIASICTLRALILTTCQSSLFTCILQHLRRVESRGLDQ